MIDLEEKVARASAMTQCGNDNATNKEFDWSNEEKLSVHHVRTQFKTILCSSR